MRRSFSFAVGSILLSSAVAHAEDPKGVHLIWSRAPSAASCVGAAGLEEDVRHRLPSDPFRATPVEREIEGIILKNGEVWEARFAMRDVRTNRGLGERTLRSAAESCASLSEAVGVAITLAIDPRVTAEPRAPEILEPSLVGEKLARPTQPAPRRRGGSSHLRAVSLLGLIPGAALGAEVDTEIALATRFDLGIGLFVLPESRHDDFGFASGGLRASGCLVLHDSRAASLGACGDIFGGVFASYLHPSATLGPNDVGDAPWLGAGISLEGGVRIAGPVELSARAGGVVPITRKRAFVTGRPSPEWEQARVGLLLGVGIGIRWDDR